MTETQSAPGLVTGTWTIDTAHSEVTFAIRHLMNTVRGTFHRFTGRIEVARELFASTVHAEIEMASLDTRNADRDAHVRSADFLEVERYPVMTFTAKDVLPATVGRRARQSRYEVVGDLTIRDVTREVRLLTEYHGVSDVEWEGTRVGFTASTVINRRDFGIEFNIPLRGDRYLLGDEIEVGLEIQAVYSGRP
ncbi:MAG: polyisoprenoid-binding protein [Streptosporangiales bacterium]|nr:polyisoprenoid-binding protein [Streptosporangiales bacterium]